MRDLEATPGQTVGPFFHCALPYPGDNQLVSPDRSDAIALHGVVYDGAGLGVPDALVELWQAGPDGAVMGQPRSLRRDGSTFTGWGRAATDGAGGYRFTTLRPGITTAGRPAFFALTVFARGLLDRLFTRAYLPGDHLDADPLLARLAPSTRQALVCAPESAGYRFDIHLQGNRESVFLAYADSPR